SCVCASCATHRDLHSLPTRRSSDLWTKNGESQLIHFIGKDNIVFHCIIFPAMLEAHGELVLPTNVPANEFLNLEGNKISTSRNRSEEHTSELQSRENLVCRLLLENK